MTTKDQYVLVNIEANHSKLNHGIYYRLTWIRINDMTRWESTVDDSYQNFTRNGWDDICINKRWGVYEGLRESSRKTQRQRNVITADSRPDRVINIDTQDLAIDVVIAEQERLTKQYSNSIFDQVFVTA